MALQTIHASSACATPFRVPVPPRGDLDRSDARDGARDGARDPHRIAGMSLRAFASAGLVVRVRSRLLGEEVLFASDNARVDRQDLAVYRAAELEELLGADEAEVMALHARRRPQT